MRPMKESGWSLIETILVVALILVVAGVLVLELRSNFYDDNAKKYFGISNAEFLSNDEKTMLEPMVINVLEKLGQASKYATSEALMSWLKRNITPEESDQAVAELRVAREKKREALKELEGACKTAEYFSLVSEKSKWCQ